MSPELWEFVLSLPLDVRQELAKCDGPGWKSIRAPLLGALVELCPQPPVSGDAVYDDVSGNRRAWLPVSPIAIALHAAKLSGREGSHTVSLTVQPCFGSDCSGAYLVTGGSPRDKSDVRVEYEAPVDGTAKDPAGHRAAIALLQKVMDERKVPNAEP